MKKTLVYASLILVLLAAGAAGALYLLQDRLQSLEAMDAMPERPMLLVRLPDENAWPAMAAEQAVDEALAKGALWAGFRRACAAWRGEETPVSTASNTGTDSSAVAQPSPAQSQGPSAEGSLWAACYLSGGGRFDWLLVQRQRKSGFQRKASPADNRFEGIDCHRGPDDTWSFQHRGLRVWASSRVLLEDAVRRVQGITALPEDVSFDQVRALAQKSQEATIYLNWRACMAYVGLSVQGAYAANMQGLAGFTDWMALDMRLLDDVVFLNGFTTAAEGRGIRRFGAPASAEWRVDEVLPAQTRLCWRVGGGDSLAGLFRPDYRRSTADLEDPWRLFADGEWAYALTQAQDADLARYALWVLRVREPALVDETLASISDAVSLYEGRAIRRLNGTEPAISLRFGAALQSFDTAWFTRLGDFLVLATDPRTLEQCADRFDRGETLRTQLGFAALRERLLPTANATLYLDPPALASLAAGMVVPGLRDSLPAALRRMGNVHPVALQFDRYRDVFLANGFLVAGPSAEGQSDASLWTLRLDTVMSAAPRFVRDHRNGKTECLLEDAGHRIYLVDAGGQVQWKKQLDGPILGEVHQVDFYRNGKLQYAFATPQRIHLLDRNGNNVADYPIALSAGAASGLQVIDYDGKRDYRFFVAGDNSNFYGYYQTGKPLPGWNPIKGLGKVHVPVTHTAWNGKDYLALASADGRAYLKDRRGENRIPAISLAAPLLGPWQAVRENEEMLLIGCDTLGTVYRLHLDGTLDRRATPRVHAGSRFAGRNLDQQGGVEWLVLSDNRLEAREPDGSPRWNWDLPDEGPHGWSLSGEGAQTLIAVWSPVSGEWSVLDAAGEPLPGFPTTGGGPCAIGKIQGNRVMVGARGGVVEARRLP